MRIHVLLALPLMGRMLYGAEYSKEDREQLLTLLEESKRQVAVALEGISHEQSKWTPDSNRWTILQVAEHLSLAEDFLFTGLMKALETAKPLPPDQPLPDPREIDQLVLQRIPDRTQKAKSPEATVPKGAPQDRDEAFRAFTEKREKTMKFVTDTKLNLRRYQLDSPVGKLDAHQWLMMIAAHTQRHIKQISEVTQHELYPKTQ
ncbi:MAG TPA: DinB family protein [Bryobacteraceae bacterium]|nr:DinB family protein [Bryobacteraceae bacterium]